MRNVASSVEPAVRGKARCETQQHFVGKLRYIKHRPATKSVTSRQHGQEVHWIEQPAAEPIVASRHDCYIDLATLETAGQSCATVLDQMNLNANVSLLITRQELRKEALDRLWGG